MDGWWRPGGTRAVLRGSGVGVVAATLWMTATAVLELQVNPEVAQFIGVLAAAPLLAAVLARPVATAGVGVAALAVGVWLGHETGEAGSEAQRVRLLSIAVAAVVAVVASAVRERRERQLREVTAIADVAQRAVLRPEPPAVPDARIAVRYLSAHARAHIGGDLYEVVVTRHGTRLLIGDVRGKGLEAVRLSAVALGSFREAAHREEDLVAVARALDAAVARDADEEDFVTALLVQLEPERRLRLVCCGHPAPLAVAPDGGVRRLPVCPAPPLGMAGSPEATTDRLGEGERLLLFTDGVTEARAGRQFFPVEQAASRALCDQPVEEGLRTIERDLTAWVGGRLVDDVALLAVDLLAGADPLPDASRLGGEALHLVRAAGDDEQVARPDHGV